MKPDAIVIGAGPNGLTAAACLGKAGRKVLVLERAARIGGLAAMEEFHPGYRVPGVLHETRGFRDWVAAELALGSHGLSFLPAAPPVYGPRADGPGLLLGGAAGWEESLGEDAAAWREWRQFLEAVGPFVRRLLDAPPFDPEPEGWKDRLELGGAAWRFRRLGRATLTEFARVMPMCAADWMRAQFQGGHLQALLAGAVMPGAFTGPWSPGTAANLLLAECSAGPGLRGGPAALVTALEQACHGHEAEVRTDSEVAEIRTANGAVTGVALQNGDSFDAPLVLAGCDPKRTFLELLPPAAIPEQLEERILHLRTRGATAKVNLALDGALAFDGHAGPPVERARTGAHLDELERAFDAAKYRQCSARPHLDISVPSVSDPSLAPEGHAVVSILASFAPYDREGGWNDAARNEFGDAVVAELERYAPGIASRVVARQVLAPPDLEQRYGLSGGHLFHGEHALDQLLSMRPAPECARYATPLKGLYLCSSGSHPGGGITGAPGALAARAVLAS